MSLNGQKIPNTPFHKAKSDFSVYFSIEKGDPIFFCCTNHVNLQVYRVEKGLKLDIYVGYLDKLSVFNAGFFSNYGTNAPINGLNVNSPLECSSAQFSFTLTSQTYTGPLFEALVKSRQKFTYQFV